MSRFHIAYCLCFSGCLEMEVLPYHNLLFISAALLFRSPFGFKCGINYQPPMEESGIAAGVIGNLIRFARNVEIMRESYVTILKLTSVLSKPYWTHYRNGTRDHSLLSNIVYAISDAATQGNAVLQSWDPTLRAGTTKMRRHVHGREFCVPESETPSRPIRNAVLQSWDPTLVNPSTYTYDSSSGFFFSVFIRKTLFPPVAKSGALSSPDSTLPIVDENHSSSPSLPSVVPIGAPCQQVFLLARRQKKIYVDVFDLAPIMLTLSFSGCLEMGVLPYHNLLFISAALLFRCGVQATKAYLIYMGDVVKFGMAGVDHHYSMLSASIGECPSGFKCGINYQPPMEISIAIANLVSVTDLVSVAIVVAVVFLITVAIIVAVVFLVAVVEPSDSAGYNTIEYDSLKGHVILPLDWTSDYKLIAARLAALRLDLDEEMIVSFFDFIRTVISRRSWQQSNTGFSNSDWSSLAASFPLSKKAGEDICRTFLAHPGCLEMEVLPHHNLLFISAALLFK
ncbi:hypothetical protein HHK36_001975 [Tetracentron sinense]|uniref:Uncharacterized protein n=1 Tax=Tetracentron sinense TaxID=13715 RepID=A0A835A4P6_TETSI|nr:hypothetical protein HHK36_001975 [Tetracentron sinense]